MAGPFSSRMIILILRCYLKSNIFFLGEKYRKENIKMEIKDIVSVIGVYIFGIFTQAIADDSSSIVQCRMDIMNLESLLTSWSIMVPYRGYQFDPKKIEEIKQLLRLLNVHYAGLFIGYPKLPKLIDSNLDIVRRYEYGKNEPQNKPHCIREELLRLWKCTPDCKKSEIQKLEPFLRGGRLKRLCLRVKVLVLKA